MTCVPLLAVVQSLCISMKEEGFTEEWVLRAAEAKLLSLFLTQCGICPLFAFVENGKNEQEKGHRRH